MIQLSESVAFEPGKGTMLTMNGEISLTNGEKILLELLLTNSGEKNKIIEAVWGCRGVVVTEASYHQLIRSLRKRFADAGLDPASIKTVPRFGVRYSSPLPDNTVTKQCIDEGYKKPASVWRGDALGVLLIMSVVSLSILASINATTKSFVFHERVKQVNVHYFQGAEITSRLRSEIAKRVRNENGDVYVARNGPGVWFSVCPGPMEKRRKSCRHEYFSLY